MADFFCGNYTFTLIADVKSQGGKKIKKTVEFIIQPAFYESLWFKIVLIVYLNFKITLNAKTKISKSLNIGVYSIYIIYKLWYMDLFSFVLCS